MAKLEITTIAKKGNKCVIYNDDGMFCTWTDKKEFNFEVIAETKANANGVVMLVSEEEAQTFAGEHMTIENHEAWTLPRYILWNVCRDVEADEDDVKLVEFIKEHLI